MNPFDYNKTNKPVYGNILKHFLIIVNIAENINAQSNKKCIIGNRWCYKLNLQIFKQFLRR